MIPHHPRKSAPRWTRLAAAGLVLSGLLATTSMAASSELPVKARFYLSWHAPFGSPRATDTLSAACGDTSGRDTLWLSMQIDADSTNFYAYSMALLFRAQPGDTLGPNWWFGGKEANPWNVRVEWVQDSWKDCHKLAYFPPWTTVNYDRTKESGRLYMNYTIRADRSKVVGRDTLYCLARILFPRPRLGQANCNQPICIEWSFGQFSFDLYGEDTYPSPGSRRFVSWNSPRGEVCRTFMSAPDSFAGDPTKTKK